MMETEASATPQIDMALVVARDHWQLQFDVENIHYSEWEGVSSRALGVGCVEIRKSDVETNRR